MKNRKKMSLQSLILILLSFAMLGTFTASMISSVKVSKENLERSYLNENLFYAKKLADITDSHFKNLLLTLETGTHHFEDERITSDEMYHELKHILESTNFFNAIFFINEKGVIVRSAPQYGLEGIKAETYGVKQSLAMKEAYISEPYIGITKRITILVSYPVFDENGKYQGFLGGTIYLDEKNSIQNILALHPQHSSDSYVYVVDSKGNIIYHPDKNRIRENVMNNKVVKEVTKGMEGKTEVIYTKGTSMLAGYAFVETSKWGVVSQTPKEAINKPTYLMLEEMSKSTIPLFIVVFLISLLLLKRIANPLQKLAEYAHDIAEKKHNIKRPAIPNRYLELNELKNTMFLMVDHYQNQIQTFETEATIDPLTELYNRRHLNKVIPNYNNYSIILFDIDRFKSVNDEFGHLMGDEVLKFVARLIKQETRDQDLACRFGGEEFLVLLPETSLEITYRIAERIRKTVETTESPIGKTITVSLGIGNMPENATHYTELMDLTDQALYKAKNDGRNRTVKVNQL